MRIFIYIIAYIILIAEIIWWITCTKRKDIPLILELILLIFSLIPGLHVISVIAIPGIAYILYDNNNIELKDNWFNKTFLSCHE